MRVPLDLSSYWTLWGRSLLIIFLLDSLLVMWITASQVVVLIIYIYVYIYYHLWLYDSALLLPHKTQISRHHSLATRSCPGRQCHRSRPLIAVALGQQRKPVTNTQMCTSLGLPDGTLCLKERDSQRRYRDTYTETMTGAGQRMIDMFSYYQSGDREFNDPATIRLIGKKQHTVSSDWLP